MGGAGLSLAYFLSQSTQKDKRILLIDKSRKDKNDRTWCFWEAGENPFEAIVHHSWQHLYFKSPQLEQVMDIAPYRYKMIQGIDFYNYVLHHLANYPNIEIIHDAIKALHNAPSSATVTTASGATYEGRYIFNSVMLEKPDTSESNYIAQHFGGWVIRTHQPILDPKTATLMDFRIPQANETRFMYFLPTSKHTALIEATAFSNNILSEAGYDEMIRDYIRNYTDIPEGSFEITHKEIGVIPMTTYDFKQHNQKNIIHIGTMGGRVKPSTGYAFVRIQEQAQEIVQALEKNQSPHLKRHWFHKRFSFYDNVLLNVMLNNRVPTHRVFSRLFKRNGGAKVFQFLSEQTNFVQEMIIVNAAPNLPFIVAAFDEMLFKPLQRMVGRKAA